jgi:hypothetical protein
MPYVILGNDSLCSFLTKKKQKKFMIPNRFFDQVPNKGFALQFATRQQEFGLRGSYLDGS